MAQTVANGKPPGLLARLSRLVRNPSTDWPATEVCPHEAHAHVRRGASHAAARATVSIRNHEFDVLRREMRNRKTLSSESLEGLSLPSTLLPPIDPVSRRHTLHKIDAIEREIQAESQTGASTLPPHPEFAGSALHPAARHRVAKPRRSDALPTAAQIGPRASADGTPAMLPPPLRRPPLRHRPGSPVTGRAAERDHPDADAAPTPAAVEVAAFDFADGRDARAEEQLTTGLQIASGAELERIYQALLDLYWATGRQAALQSASLDFVQRFGRIPVQRPDDAPFGASSGRLASVSFGPELDAVQVQALANVVDAPQPQLALDFSSLLGIPPVQRPALAALFERINERAIALDLVGEDRLREATALPPAPNAADAALRLQTLRLIGDEAGFVDLAVQLATVHELSPVDWAPPRFRRVAPAADRSSTGRAASVESGASDDAGDTLQLAGELRARDIAAPSLDTILAAAATVTVRLDAVRRIDFAAATELLNWCEAQSRRGASVELRGAHSLIVPLLQSVGLDVAR